MMLEYSKFYPQFSQEINKKRKRSEKKRRYRLRLKEKKNQIIAEAKSVPCTDCEQIFLPEELEFDHLRDKKFDIGGSRSKRNISIKKLLIELEKCEVVCTACHTTRERARGRPR